MQRGVPFAWIKFKSPTRRNRVWGSPIHLDVNPKTQVPTTNLGHPSRLSTFSIIRR